ncbi:MAG: extracellular solute-binding protein, partial [SAR324 cluster bacterium]|nr:extracellular solute-binding protein [SAR324 cluster bacterium]
MDNSDPFAALAFRFALVALGFFLFSIYSKQKILVSKRNFFESFFSGVLFHGFYLGGVFYSISIGMPTAIAALIVTLQPILTNALSGPILNEKVSTKQWIGVLLGFAGAGLVLGFDVGSKIPAAGLMATSAAKATEIEVMHWWTSGGEAAAVGEFAKAFDATGDKWVDAAFAGPGEQARAIMVSRITGGDPMGAFQFNHGRQAEDLIEAGLLLDLTEIAEAEGWKDVVNPSKLLDACTVDGRIYCTPVNIHSWQWLWLSRKAYQDAGIAVPTNWDEFVAAAPKLEAAGKLPLAVGQQGWQQTGLFNVLMVSLVPTEIFQKVYGDK